MSENLGTATLELDADDSKLTRKLDKAERDVDATAKRSGKKFGTVLSGGLSKAGLGIGAVVTGVVLGMKKVTDAASNLGESQNAVNVTFGESSKKIDEFAKKAGREAGLSMRAFNELVTPVGASLQNVGFSADEAADASIALTKRAADMASVFNVDVSEALGAIQAGLRGEADPLEKFGVGLSATAVQAKAMEMGLAKVASELTTQDKMQARLALLMEQSNRVAGDFVNTSDSLANRQRIASAEFENLQAKLGQKLIPVFANLTEAALAVITWTEQNWPKFERIMTETIDKLKPVIDNIRARIDAIVDTIRGVIKIITGIKNGEWSLVWDGIKQVVVDGIGGMAKAMLELPLKILEVAGEKTWAGLSKIGKWIVGAIVDGIKAAIKGIKDAVDEALDGVLGRVEHYVDKIKSAFERVGGWIGKLDPRGSELGTRLGPGATPTGVTAGLGSITNLASQHGLMVTSGFRLGDPGDHGKGKAVDISNTYRGDPDGTPEMDRAFLALASLAGPLGIKDLLYEPGLWKYGFNIDNGRRAAFTVDGHGDHVHASVFDTGGWLMPGLTMAYNGTGKPERVVGPGGDEGGDIVVMIDREVLGRVSRREAALHARRGGS